VVAGGKMPPLGIAFCPLFVYSGNIKKGVSAMRIKITENGPYHVAGRVPIRETIMTSVGDHRELAPGRELPQGEEYFLCRCGHSKNAPFCDGTHVSVKFHGAETASREPYAKRVADMTKGKTMVLLDDDRCAYARFCHRGGESIWDLTEQDRDPRKRAEALKAAADCPSGRLVMANYAGEILEEANTPEIVILQDPEEGVSAGIFVKGPIVVEAADGAEYEVRNRVTLCRCGKSEDKPFCDASHVCVRYVDRK